MTGAIISSLEGHGSTSLYDQKANLEPAASTESPFSLTAVAFIAGMDNWATISTPLTSAQKEADKNGEQLILAAEQGNLETVQKLLANSPEISRFDIYIALTNASGAGHLPIVQALLNPRIPAHFRKLAVIAAEANQHQSIVQCIRNFALPESQALTEDPSHAVVDIASAPLRRRRGNISEPNRRESAQLLAPTLNKKRICKIVATGAAVLLAAVGWIANRVFSQS